MIQQSARQPLVSVIMCVYNTASFLPAAVQAVLNQTFTSLELILVDDGSDDGSEKICDQKAEQDYRVHVFHKPNSGISDSRNLGLEKSRGEYITFVDSDDLIRADFLENVLGAMTANEADLGACGYQKVLEDFSLNDASESGTAEGETVYRPEELVRAAYLSQKKGVNFTLWGKVYRKGIFTEHAISFPSGEIHEDIYVLYRVFYYCRKAVYIEAAEYYYRMRNNSIMHTTFGRKNLDALKGTRRACVFFSEKGKQELTALAVNYHLRLYFRDLYEGDRNRIFGRGERKEFVQDLRQDVAQYTNMAELSFAKKAAFRLAARIPIKPFVCLVMLK